MSTNKWFQLDYKKSSGRYCGRLSSASAMTSNFWLNSFISVNNSIIMYALGFKFHTHVEWYKVTLYMYIKFHNSELNINKLLPIFTQKFRLNLFISVNNLRTMYAIAFKLHTPVQCHKVTIYSKFHNSDFNINEIIALF